MTNKNILFKYRHLMSMFLDCFSMVPMKGLSKLECLSLAGIAILAYCFSVMPGAYPGVDPLSMLWPYLQALDQAREQLLWTPRQ